MRRLGVAAASAALVGTIAAVMPAGIAHAASTPIPSPIGNLCTTNDQTSCWRATSIVDQAGADVHGTLPAVSGDRLVLNKEGEANLANAAWWNNPITITGQSIAVSFKAYFDLGAQAGPPPAHGQGLAFALIEGDNNVTGNNNHPAPVPFDPASNVTEYGAGGNGLGFSGFDGNTGNLDGRKNLGLAVLTSSDDGNVGTDQFSNASRVGLLKGQRWPDPMNPLPTDQDPHIRTGRWYGTNAADVTPNIYGGQPTQVNMQLTPKQGAAGTWLATVYVNGEAKFTNTEVQLPPIVYFGFTSGTFDFPQRQAVSDVSIAYGAVEVPAISASPNPVNVGSVPVGLTSAAAPVTLKNDGLIDANVSLGSAPAGFSVSGLPVTLHPGDTAAASVKFAPTATGAAGGNVTLNVASSAGNGTSSFAVSGNGVAAGTSIGAPYTAVPPTRILDTRPNNGVGPEGTKSVKVTGVGGVPANADAVIMNVTVTEPTADGFITVYPTGTARPTASNLNFVAGQNIANLVTAKVGTGGQVNIYNFDGTTHVLFDVVGYFPAGGGATALSASAAQGGEFVPLSPARILDTRSGSGPLGPNSSLDLQVTGNGGVPATGVAAVVMNVTGTNTTAPGFLTAWPTGQTRQTTSTLNFVANQSVPNLAVVPIGTGGKVSIYNFDGNTDVIADVVGYYTAAGVTVPGGGLFHAMSPLRFLDTRPEADNKTLADGGTVTTPIVGVAGIPAEAVGVVANVTATNTTVPGFLTVFPAGSAVPGTSSLNFTGHEPGVPNLVMSKLGSGAIDIFNFSPGGTTDAIVDVVGWYGPA